VQLCLKFSFVQGGGCNLPSNRAGLCGSEEGRWCVVFTCWGCRSTQAEMGPFWWGICMLCLHDMGSVRCRIQFSLIHSVLLFSEKKKKERN
jgi:hypothetical protein